MCGEVYLGRGFPGRCGGWWGVSPWLWYWSCLAPINRVPEDPASRVGVGTPEAPHQRQAFSNLPTRHHQTWRQNSLSCFALFFGLSSPPTPPTSPHQPPSAYPLLWLSYLRGGGGGGAGQGMLLWALQVSFAAFHSYTLLAAVGPRKWLCLPEPQFPHLQGG